jgi:hypothetical protein
MNIRFQWDSYCPMRKGGRAVSQAHRRTDMTKLIIASRNFADAPKNEHISTISLTYVRTFIRTYTHTYIHTINCIYFYFCVKDKQAIFSLHDVSRPQKLLLTYLLTPWRRVLLEKLTGFAASQEIPGIYGTRKFITVLTSARHYAARYSPLEKLPPRRSQWGTSLPTDCFVSRGSISSCEYYLPWVFTGRVVSTSPIPQAGEPPLVGCPLLLIQFIHSYRSFSFKFVAAMYQPSPSLSRACSSVVVKALRYKSEGPGIDSRIC